MPSDICGCPNSKTAASQGLIANRLASILATNSAIKFILTPQPAAGAVGNATVVSYNSITNVIGHYKDNSWRFYYRIGRQPVATF